MLHTICGRAKSGKTEEVYRVLEDCIRQKRHTFFLVPEQSAVDTERTVIERLGNPSNEYVEVINFKRLCNRVFRETGGLTQTYVDGAHKLLLMSCAVDAVRESLSAYRGAAENADFPEKALEVVGEFRLFGVSPRDLENAGKKLGEEGRAGLSAKLRDFSLLYAAYQELLANGFTDSFDDMERLCEVLDKSRFFVGKTVVLDGFYGFTVPEKRILDRVLRDADDVYVTFLLDKNGERPYLTRSQKAFRALTASARDQNVGIETVYPSYHGAYETEGLRLLEERFGCETALTEPHIDGVTAVPCRDLYEEAATAAALVRALVCERGVPYSRIAICARDPEAYEGVLDTALAKNDIPFHLHKRCDLITRPAAAYILSAFEIVQGWSKSAVIRHIKTGLTALTEEEADAIETYIRTWNLQGSAFTAGEWFMNPDGYSADRDERSEATLALVEEARKKLVAPLEAFCEDVRAASCVNEISAAVTRLLAAGKYDPEQLSDEEITYHNLIMDALDCLADVEGNDALPPRVYATRLEQLLRVYDAGRLPSVIDEVRIAGAELFRAPKTDYMILLGMNEGVFPRSLSPDAIFSDPEREELRRVGIELDVSGAEAVADEYFLAYTVMTAPQKGLYLLFCEQTPAGEQRAPSPLFGTVRDAIGGLCTAAEDVRRAWNFYGSTLSLSEESRRADDRETIEALRRYLRRIGAAVPKDDFAAAEYLSPQTAADLFGDRIALSPSRLESFGHCACSYFGTYTLGLRPEPVAQLGAAEAGNIIHKILELVIAELAEKKKRGEELTREDALSRVDALLCAYIDELTGGDKAKAALSGRFRYLYGRLSGALNACVSVMTDEMAGSDFLPVDFEMTIGGKNADIPFSGIAIPGENGEPAGLLFLHGKIDRTDIYEKDGKTYLKVVDYKTGSKKFDLADVSAGMNLQMLLYLYSLTKNGSERYGGKEIVPAGVLYTPVHRPTFSAQLGEDIGKDEGSSFKPNGILIDDLAILNAMEKGVEGRFLPVKVKKDGGYYSYSSVIEPENMQRLLRTAAYVAAEMAKEMKQGKIAKNPYKCQINSCAYCDMAPFCRYEGGEKGTRYAFARYSEETFETSVAKGGEDA